MRRAALLLVGAALSSCATPQETASQNAAAQSELATLLAGKTAAAPISCIPTTNTSDMRIIDGQTVAYRLGSKTTYVVHLSQGCANLRGGNYTLVTEQFGGNGPCRGDAARVVDLPSRMPAGSCIIADIIPYSRPG
jgi:hypothetical protein